MTDVVVTVPKAKWEEWLEEGDLPGDDWSGLESQFFFRCGAAPRIEPGERVYIVAHGRLRGYAPLVRIDRYGQWYKGNRAYGLVRRDGAVAVTIRKPIRGFQGFRYRWWKREDEEPFPWWRADTEGSAAASSRT